MNFGELQTMLWERFGFKPSLLPQADVIARFKRDLNIEHKKILGTRGLSRLRRTVLPFTSVANSPYAVLPQAASHVYTITDRVNNWVLDAMTMEDIRAINPGLLYTTSYPQGYAVMDLSATVAQDPTAAAELFVKSDSASDGATKKVMIEGTITGGYYQTASVALNGITAVSVSSAITNWVTVNKFFIAPVTGTTVLNAAGNVTLTMTSGAGTELARIPPGKYYPRYTKIHWQPIPTGVNTYYADIDRHIEDMAQVSDESYLPEEFHWLLESGAAMRELKRRGKLEDYGVEKSDYKDGVDRLKAYVRRMGGVARNRTPRDRTSQLGPWFPAGS